MPARGYQREFARSSLPIGIPAAGMAAATYLGITSDEMQLVVALGMREELRAEICEEARRRLVDRPTAGVRIGFLPRMFAFVFPDVPASE